MLLFFHIHFFNRKFSRILKRGYLHFLFCSITCALTSGKRYSLFLQKAFAFWKKILFTAYCLLPRNTAAMQFLPACCPLILKSNSISNGKMMKKKAARICLKKIFSEHN